jgi:hypothetical protein
MKKRKEGSKIGKLEVKYKESGREAAIKYGVSIGMKENRARNLTASWDRQSGKLISKMPKLPKAVKDKAKAISEKVKIKVAKAKPLTPEKAKAKAEKADALAIKAKEISEKFKGLRLAKAQAKLEKKLAGETKAKFKSSKAKGAEAVKAEAGEVKNVNVNSTKPRVYDTALEQSGVLLAEGPDQSEVRYDDGTTRFTINKLLKKEGSGEATTNGEAAA